mmetsp:Transcript_16130/g.40796  ORF Transcript_16130/g.40796 Transcript_16130/m.40796 type:complete len:88 (-) Transcript_16130:1-264(-)
MDFIDGEVSPLSVLTGALAIGASMGYLFLKGSKKEARGFDEHRGESVLTAEERRKALKHRGWGYDVWMQHSCLWPLIYLAGHKIQLQ